MAERCHLSWKTTSLAAAQQLATAGNPPAVLDALRRLLHAELTAVTHQAAAADDPVDAGSLPRPSGARDLAADYLRIATTGLYDTARYRSPSEARQAVLDAAVWAGLTLPAVLARLENGTWPGLAAFYTRYRQPRNPPQGDPRRLAQSPRLRHRPAGQETHPDPCP